MYWWGSEGDFNILVMDLLGSSLEDLFAAAKRKFSLKTILLLADQLVIFSETIQRITSFKELNIYTQKALYTGILSRITF